jgi:hypothetical protein
MIIGSSSSVNRFWNFNISSHQFNQSQKNQELIGKLLITNLIIELKFNNCPTLGPIITY